MFERINCRNFSPTYELETYANTRLERLTSHVPSDACITATCEKQGGKYHFSFDMVSSAAKFASESHDDDFLVAFGRLEGQIDESLSIWQRSRMNQMGV